MKLSWQWLQEFVNLSDIPAEEIGEKLTLHTAELEEIIYRAEKFKDVVCGKLTSIAAHPESEKLSVAQFDLGAKGKAQIIFGKVHEVQVGEILPVALPGAHLGSGIKIEKSSIKGIESAGMIADNLELGLKNPGLMRFMDETFIGKSLAEVCKALEDTCFDIDNKSLTHRPDLVGHRGFARELAAIYDAKLNLPEPVVALPETNEKISVEVLSTECRRFTALKIENVTVGSSPLATQMRLENLGVRAISNLVDITNLIMLEYGQPMHVFDADKVVGGIIVRPAKAGESLVALDGETYELTTEDMVIADQEKALSIAGIMGGLASSVTNETTNIIFESANFDPVIIRKTSQRLGLRSESSMRFEKSLDPEQCKKALMAASEKCLQLCSQAKVASLVADNFPRPYTPNSISFPLSKVQKLSGLEIDWRVIKTILGHLGFSPVLKDEVITVQVPSWRSTKDVSITEDIIEEIVRLYGLDKVPTKLPRFTVEPPQRNQARILEWSIRSQLASLGYNEVYLHSFIGTDAYQDPDKEYVSIENPLSEECKYLRRDLWPQMIAKLESELRQNRKVQLFEIGKIYVPQDAQVLPIEEPHALMLQADFEIEENQAFFRLKSDLKNLFKQLNVDDWEFKVMKAVPAHFHPAKSIEIYVGGESVGILGVLHPRFAPAKNGNLVLAEFNLGPVLKAALANQKKFARPSIYPSVNRDISLIVDHKCYAADIIKTALSASDKLVSIRCFDEFKDDTKIGVGLKNLAFHLVFQDQAQTLTDTEIELEFERILGSLQTTHQAKLRLDFDKS